MVDGIGLFVMQFFTLSHAKGDGIMATKSIIKDVNIRDKKLCRTFASAIENASGRRGKDVQLSRSFKEISGEKIRELFGNKA